MTTCTVQNKNRSNGRTVNKHDTMYPHFSSGWAGEIRFPTAFYTFLSVRPDKYTVSVITSHQAIPIQQVFPKKQKLVIPSGWLCSCLKRNYASK